MTDRFKFVAESSELELFIYGSISSWNISARWVAETLRAHPNAKTIKLRINSPGGSVFEGAAIFNLLARHPAKKEVDIDGLAASAASWIVMAGDVRRIGLNGFFMIHEAQGEAWGPATELEKTAALLRKMNAQQIDLYAKRSKLSRAAIAKAVEEETWYTAAEALKAGFVTATSADLDAVDPASALVEVDSQLAEFGFRKAPTQALTSFSFAANAERTTREPVPDDVLALALSAVPVAPNQLELIGSNESPAPEGAQEESSMNKILIATALGIAATLPDDAFEAAIVALADKCKALEPKAKASGDALAHFDTITGKTGDESLSVVKSWKTTAERVPALDAEVATLKAEGAKRDLDALIKANDSTGSCKLTPALEAKIREQIAAGDMTLKGAQAFVETLPVIAALANAKKDIQAPPAPGTASTGTEPQQHNGKTFGAMSPAERESLKKADKATYDAMRAEWIKAGRPAA
jgi:ATP-dependent protease ClpP protease subunit